MKRKPAAESAPLAESEILAKASRALRGEEPLLTAKCVVCQGECAPNSSEGLCWVCRRLKISAWRDNDGQPSLQE